MERNAARGQGLVLLTLAGLLASAGSPVLGGFSVPLGR